jgi:hypothetical protein
MAMSLGAAIHFAVDAPWLKAVLTLLGVILGVSLYRLPSRDR